MIGQPGNGGIIEHGRGIGNQQQAGNRIALALEPLGRLATEDTRVTFADQVEQSDDL